MAVANPLCSNPRCRSPRHEPGCTDTECKLHSARLAADGVNLCPGHLDWLGGDAVILGQLYGELELVLMRTGSSGEKVSGTGAEPPAPRDRVVETRTEIRHVLAATCRRIADERGIQLPAHEVSAMGTYVAKHATWLAAHSAAGEVSDELGSLRRRAWSAAYPTGTKVVTVGQCPIVLVPEIGQHDWQPQSDGCLRCLRCSLWASYDSGDPCVSQEMCGGMLRAIVRPSDQLLPSEVACDADPSHRWDSTQWRQLDRLVSTRRAA